MRKELFQQLEIKYLYREIGTEEKDMLIKEMDKHPALSEDLFSILPVKQALDDLFTSPSESTVERIIAASKREEKTYSV